MYLKNNMLLASRKQLGIFDLKHINWHAEGYYHNILHSTLINQSPA